MNKEEFLIYISKDNPGFYKTRKSHINKVAPNILNNIENHIKVNKLTPINFNDSLNYYIKKILTQNKCKVCNKIIHSKSNYCSNLCKKKDVKTIINKTYKTLLEKNGSSSPLGSSKAKEKRKKTCLKKYGTEHPSSNNNVKYKIKNTNIQTYKNKDLKNKLSKKIKEAYSNDSFNIIEKRKQTNLKKYGEYKILTSNAINKAKNTLNKKYGVTNPFEINENTYEKAKMGSIRFFSNKDNKNKSIEKRKQTNLKKYGGDPNCYPPLIKRRRSKIKEKIQSKIQDKIIIYDEYGILECKCRKNHTYTISTNLLNSRLKHNNILCTICNPPLNHFQSSQENELYNFISKYTNCKQNVKTLLPKFEADILVEDKKLIYEFNGIYWHSDIYKGKNYHQIKTNEFKKIGYSVIHIWEDLWYNKKEIIYDKIKYSLGIVKHKLNARNCDIKEIETSESRNFLDNNHIMGFNKSSFAHFGLLYKDELVYLISLSKRKIFNKDKNNYELLRVCSKLGFSIRGGFSKLFNFILKKYPGNYISYADLSWGEGNVYKYGGFKLIGFTKPNYWYIIDNQRFHRYTFRKSELVKKGHNKDKTEFQIMDEDIKALRIYDCGNAIWKFNNE